MIRYDMQVENIGPYRWSDAVIPGESDSGAWVRHSDIAPALAAIPLAVEALRAFVTYDESSDATDVDLMLMYAEVLEKAKAALEALGVSDE